MGSMIPEIRGSLYSQKNQVSDHPPLSPSVFEPDTIDTMYSSQAPMENSFVSCVKSFFYSFFSACFQFFKKIFLCKGLEQKNESPFDVKEKRGSLRRSKSMSYLEASDDTSSEQARLKDGSSVPLQYAIDIYTILLDLEKKNPVSLFQLLQKCTNDDFACRRGGANNPVNILYEKKLIEGKGVVNPDIKKIVLNSVCGDCLEHLQVVSPIR